MSSSALSARSSVYPPRFELSSFGETPDNTDCDYAMQDDMSAVMATAAGASQWH
jgi:hypothetical protein